MSLPRFPHEFIAGVSRGFRTAYDEWVTPDGARMFIGYPVFLLVVIVGISAASWVLDRITREPPGAHADRLSAYCVDHGIGSWERCVSLYEAGRIRDEELEGYR